MAFNCITCGNILSSNNYLTGKDKSYFCSKCCYDQDYQSKIIKARGIINTELPQSRPFAQRYNTGKPEMSYVDMNCLAPCARVLAFGAAKYSRNNWKKGMPVTKIIDSLMRHIGDLQDGKVLDEESKLAIIGHIQCNAMFLGNDNNEDDITKDGSLYK